MYYSRKINLGLGIGFHLGLLHTILTTWPPIEWFEIIAENFLDGIPYDMLENIIERYPVLIHCSEISIGGTAPLDWEYLKKLKRLAKKTKTPWFSDHLSWGTVLHANFHEILPLPRTSDSLNYIVERARIVQDYLELPFALENITGSVDFANNEMPEWE